MRLTSRPPLVLVTTLVLLVGLLGACSDAPDGDATATPSSIPAAATPPSDVTATAEVAVTPTSTTTAEASPTAPAGDGNVLEYPGHEIVGDFKYADAIDFPEALLVVVETGCNQCDGPTEGLYRIWRNSGETHVDFLIDATITGSADSYITSFAMQPDLSDMVVTVCTKCGNGNAFTQSPVALYRSLDGGTTWRQIDTAPPGAPISVRAVTNLGIVLEGLDKSLFYWRGEIIQPPDGAGELLPGSRHAGELRWLADGGSKVVDITGQPLALVEPGSLISDIAMDGSNLQRAVTGWGVGYVDGPFGGWTATRVGPDGRLVGFRSANYLAPVSVLREGAVLGVMSGTDNLDAGTIGYIDVLKGMLTPFAGPMLEPPFGDGSRPTGRNALHAALSGPFLRVTTGVNCLPIRATTDLNSRELTCAADGTLVYDGQGTAAVGGLQWMRVLLLDGREGYAVSTYLTDD